MNESQKSSSTDEPSKQAVRPDTESTWSAGIRLEAVANLAHELRTPIQVLLGYLDILREDFADRFCGEPRELLDRMNTNAHDLAQTIENIMQFVLAEANAEPAVNEEVTIRSLLADITPTLDAANFKKRLMLSYDFTQAPKAMRAPRRLLRSILLNLALNAIKFTESGSVAIVVRRSHDSPNEETVEIEVRDTGPGISPAHFERATKPFAQLSNTSARRYRGLGLGLAVVQRNLDLLKGRIELKNNSGRGSTFIVTLPVRPADATQMEAHKAQRKTAIIPNKPILSPAPNPMSRSVR